MDPKTLDLSKMSNEMLDALRLRIEAAKTDKAAASEMRAEVATKAGTTSRKAKAKPTKVKEEPLAVEEAKKKTGRGAEAEEVKKAKEDLKKALGIAEISFEDAFQAVLPKYVPMLRFVEVG